MPTPTEDFLVGLLSNREFYHHQKENSAYAGLVVWVGAVAAALVARTWPPEYVCSMWARMGAVAIVSAGWGAVLVYLRWQLLNRRWAAIQIAGLERYLAGDRRIQ